MDFNAAARLRATGFVRVDKAGTGFVTADDHPYFPVGLNSYGTLLPCLPPAEQERRLKQMQDAHMTATRILLCDWNFRPLPHVYNDAWFTRLRDTIDRCASHGIRTLVCLELGAVATQYHLQPAPFAPLGRYL